jgi:hypothetical protein
MSLGETSGSELDLNMPLNSVGGNKLFPCLVKVNYYQPGNLILISLKLELVAASQISIITMKIYAGGRYVGQRSSACLSYNIIWNFC